MGPPGTLGALLLDLFWSRMARLVTNLGSRVRPLLSFGSPLGSVWMVCCVFSVTFWLRASVCLNCSVLNTICTVAQSPLVEFSRAQWLTTVLVNSSQTKKHAYRVVVVNDYCNMEHAEEQLSKLFAVIRPLCCSSQLLATSFSPLTKEVDFRGGSYVWLANWKLAANRIAFYVESQAMSHVLQLNQRTEEMKYLRSSVTEHVIHCGFACPVFPPPQSDVATHGRHHTTDQTHARLIKIMKNAKKSRTVSEFRVLMKVCHKLFFLYFYFLEIP